MLQQNKQLRVLVERDGLSVEDAAEALGLDPEVAKMALLGDRQADVSAQQIIDEFRNEGINILKEIARNSENDNAKVKAVKILLEGKGVMPEINANALSQRLANMKRALAIVTDEANNSAKMVDESRQLAVVNI